MDDSKSKITRDCDFTARRTLLSGPPRRGTGGRLGASGGTTARPQKGLLECSTAFALVVVHKDEVHSQHCVKKYVCLIEHARNPAASKRTVASRTKSEAARSRHKRRREEEDEEDDE